MRVGFLSTSCLLLLVCGPAAAKSDLDRDTEARHDRAEPSGSDAAAEDDDDLYDPCCARDFDDDRYEPSAGTSGGSLSGELALAPHLTLDRVGGGVDLSVGLPTFFVSPQSRAGVIWQLHVSYSRWLDDYRPEGAIFRSTLHLLSVDGRVAYRYTWLTEVVDVTLSFGSGFTFLRAFESFSDGTELSETLFSGMAIGPSLRLERANSLLFGRPFVEGGVVLAAGALTAYIDEYDSLFPGVRAVMFVPSVSAGCLWELTKGAEIGPAYEAHTVGGLEPHATWAHTFLFAFRVSSYEPT